MAGGQKKGSGGSQRKRSSRGNPDQSPGEYAREAIAEWRKAAGLAGVAISPFARKAVDRVIPGRTGKGGRVGGAADALLSKMGWTGKLAAKVGAGSRLVERARSDESRNGASGNGNGSREDMPVPIQEAIEVAIPIQSAYALATRFGDYPEFTEHVEEAQRSGDSASFHVKTLTGHREIEIEIVDQRQGRRLEWRSTDGPEHTGVVSFHELAPGLTHIELSVEIEPQGIVERLSRSAHLTERMVRSEL